MIKGRNLVRVLIEFRVNVIRESRVAVTSNFL